MAKHSARGRRWARLVEAVKARPDASVCQLCWGEIDMNLKWPDPGSFAVDHILNQKDHPELRYEFTNLRPSHMKCNRDRNKGTRPVVQPNHYRATDL